MMILEIYSLGPVETNCILLGCAKTHKAVVIDAPFGAKEKIKQRANALSLKVEKLLLTHSHWDHIVDAAALKKEFSLSIYIHPLDKGNLNHPGSDGLPLFFEIEGVKEDHLFTPDEKIKIGNLELEVIHTPGHSPGGVCFYLSSEKILISGDTLFKKSIGNLSFSTAFPDLMWQSLLKLAELPQDTRVIPGHGEETTIGKEKLMMINAKKQFGGFYE